MRRDVRCSTTAGPSCGAWLWNRFGLPPHSHGMRELALRCVRAIGEAVVRFGLLWIHVPPPTWPPPPLTGPPPGHPERLCPGEVPTYLERMLHNDH
ncbi:DUF6059 family protein [Streptomyces regalis]|uniref:DUF6059 family protein n=1 Tax=Streptomyces regalis TaxID=68262 RepID=UPI003CC560AA